LNNTSEDFDINKLHAQLIMLPSIVPNSTSVSDIINSLGNEYLNAKDSLVSEVTKLIKLRVILTIPASAATAERSFSALR
jgi:hypothetical protein